MFTSRRLAQYWETHTPEVQGIAYMLSACFWFSIMAVLVRHLSQSVEPFVMVLFRNIGSLLFMLPWAMRYGVKNIHTTQPKLYFMRAISAIIGMGALFYGLSLMRLTDAIALTFTTPLITTLLAILFLKETVGYHRWIALLIGFAGVLVIIRPGGDAFQLASVFILVTASCWATSNILVKKLTASDHHKVIVFIMMVIMVPLSIPLAIMQWHAVTLEQVSWMVLLGFVANQAQASMTYAYSKMDISVVQPFDFSRLVFISILAYFIFDEVLSLWTLLGASIIFGSSMYVIYRRRK
jgi:drug/metabolite transporter (DMT)-like permease